MPAATRRRCAGPSGGCSRPGIRGGWPPGSGWAGCWLARLASGPYPELATQPPALFRPISFLRLLDAMPSPEVVAVLQALALGAAVLATVGLLTRVTLPQAWLAALPGRHDLRGLGKVVHNDVLLLLCLVLLLPSRAGAAWSLDARQRPVAARGPAFGWPVRTAMVVVSGAYFLRPVAAARRPGLGGQRQRPLGAVRLATASPEPNLFALFVADRPVLAYLVAAATLWAVELGFPLVLWRPSWPGCSCPPWWPCTLASGRPCTWTTRPWPPPRWSMVDWPPWPTASSPVPSPWRSDPEPGSGSHHRGVPGIAGRPGLPVGRRRGRAGRPGRRRGP